MKNVMNKKMNQKWPVLMVMSLLFISNIVADIKIGSITIPAKNMTQSEAQLSIPANRNAGGIMV